MSYNTTRSKDMKSNQSGVKREERHCVNLNRFKSISVIKSNLKIFILFFAFPDISFLSKLCSQSLALGTDLALQKIWLDIPGVF